MPNALNHLLVIGFTESQAFKSTLSVRKQPPPQRDRAIHGAHLLRQLTRLSEQEAALERQRADAGFPQNAGMTIALEISPPGALDYFKQLEWKRDGIEVLSVIDGGATEIVALHVPDGKLTAFEKRVRAYLEKDIKARTPGKPDKPANAALINAVSAIRKAVFDELWTEESPPPEPHETEWFQVWLRTGSANATSTREKFEHASRAFGLEVEQGYVSFPERVVVAVRGTRASLESAMELLDSVAEIRGVSPNAEFFLSELRPHEQAEWVADLRDRSTHAAPNTGPYVTILDTGVNSGHPLLTRVLDAADMHAVNPNWGTFDHAGHGTGMAGIASHGDLTGLLASANANHVPHRLESVKILPPAGQNAPHLYGWVTGQAVLKVEVPHAARQRTFAMMTTSIGQTSGLPSEWSASIDRMAFGFMGDDEPGPDADDSRRLFVLAAGNVPWIRWHLYPTENDSSTIENPGQAWNALTVGACTELAAVDAGKWPSLLPLGSAGLLSPASTTSLLWRRTWPFKPDVVAEGGNGCVDHAMANSVVVGPESLRLLTASHDLTNTPFAETGDTSAAAAEVARICGHLQARYPDYWPETLRALVVHGARITPAMRAQLSLVPTKREKEALLRRFGYGKVDLDGSINSTSKRPTMVLQEELTPYMKEGGAIKLGELNLHALPWPSQILAELGEASVALRVTLSYFIEPNPSRRGWQSKFRYQSHGLRFAVKGSTETDVRFLQRINKLEREEMGQDEHESMGDPDGHRWFLGPQLRSRGSVHSDVWFGNAAALVEKSHVAVFPVGGWWKDWADSDRHSTPVRYALVVTLDVLQEGEIDLYTPIQVAINVPVVVDVA